MNKAVLREKIKATLIAQGFKINPHLRLENNVKETIRKVHQLKRQEQIIKHKKSLLRYYDAVKKYSISGEELEPEKIQLDLIEVKSNTLEYKIFFWWNLMWWSIPYTPAFGRQLRFLLWDRYHSAPFGLFFAEMPWFQESFPEGSPRMFFNVSNL